MSSLPGKVSQEDPESVIEKPAKNNESHNLFIALSLITNTTLQILLVLLSVHHFLQPLNFAVILSPVFLSFFILCAAVLLYWVRYFISKTQTAENKNSAVFSPTRFDALALLSFFLTIALSFIYLSICYNQSDFFTTSAANHLSITSRPKPNAAEAGHAALSSERLQIPKKMRSHRFKLPLHTSPTLAKFVDPLPLPTIMKPTSKTAKETYYEVSMVETQAKLHRDLPPTTVWTYNGVAPGPTIEVRSKDLVRVKWMNKLPDTHILPVDETVHGAQHPTVKTVVHLHGGMTEALSDGYPEAWFTRDFEMTGPLFEQEVYTYTNLQPASLLWYHDHAIGITRLNVYAGLAGLYIVRDAVEDALKLPSGKYEVPLLLQDKSFFENGSLYYPSTITNGDDLPYPSIVPEFFGDSIVVNGKAWPFLNVERRKYRLRLLNGANSRFFNIFLDNGASMIQIGTESGLMEKAVEMKQILMSPGERADVIIDFSSYPLNTEIILKNDAMAPYPDGDPVNENTGVLLKFVVVAEAEQPDAPIPETLRPKQKPWYHNPQLENLFARNLNISEGMDTYGRTVMLLDGKGWMSKISEKVCSNSSEIWSFINASPDCHPMHIHVSAFEVLQRQKYDVDYYKETGKLRFIGPKIDPEPNEKGTWKDTVRANPGEVVTLNVYFGPFTGRYVWHCHMLEHEDYEMMRPFELVDCGKQQSKT